MRRLRETLGVQLTHIISIYYRTAFINPCPSVRGSRAGLQVLYRDRHYLAPPPPSLTQSRLPSTESSTLAEVTHSV